MHAKTLINARRVTAKENKIDAQKADFRRLRQASTHQTNFPIEKQNKMLKKPLKQTVSTFAFFCKGHWH